MQGLQWLRPNILPWYEILLSSWGLVDCLFFFVWHLQWCWSNLLGGQADFIANHWAVHWLDPMSIDVHYRTFINSCSGNSVEGKIRLEDIFYTIVKMRRLILLLILLKEQVGGLVLHLPIGLHWIDRSILEHLCKTWQHSLPLLKLRGYAYCKNRIFRLWNHQSWFMINQ